MAETVIELFKTEQINRAAPGAPSIEITTWFHHRRPFQTCGDIPPDVT